MKGWDYWQGLILGCVIGWIVFGFELGFLASVGASVISGVVSGIVFRFTEDVVGWSKKRAKARPSRRDSDAT